MDFKLGHYQKLGGAAAGAEMLHVVVCRAGAGAGASEFGLVVEEISDILNDPMGVPAASGRAGLLGSAIIGGRVTDFLDLEAVSGDVSVPFQRDLAKLERALARVESEVPA